MIHMIGNAHLDPVWFWDWREGFHEIKATFRSALDRMEENGQYVFTCACAGYYQWIEENAPEMFEEIVQRVREGRWCLVGGMWVQPDVNQPSGEAIARHLLLSQRYFEEKFGKRATVGYNVDSFGQGGTLPQLLKNAGIDCYVFHRPGMHENARIPQGAFRWSSPDGSEVLAFRIPDAYCTRAFGQILQDVDKARRMSAEYGIPMMCFYGVGNHGGGPTIENLGEIEALRKTANDIAYSDPNAYFAELKPYADKLPTWQGEMQHHASGCYSACSDIKRENRRTETALFTAERFAALAKRVADHDSRDMRQGYENLLFNQFHDILCGCSARERYDDAVMQHHEAQAIASRVQNAALQRISWRVDTSKDANVVRSKESHLRLWEHEALGTPCVVFNPHAFAVKGMVQIGDALARVTDEEENDVPVQKVRALRTDGADKWDALFEAEVPALGWRLYWLRRVGEAAETPCPLRVTETSIENEKLRVEFDKTTGGIVSLMDKRTGKQMLSAPNAVRLINIEHVDTWAHGVDVFDKEAGAFGQPAFMVVEEGPVRAKLRVTTTYNRSTLIQDYMLYAGGDQLEVEARLELKEKFRMVKLCFPTGKTGAKTYAEAAYGVLFREQTGDEELCHRFCGLGDAEGGLALLNDSKYSFSARDGELRLTVANSSIYADHYGQTHRDALCCHMDMQEQTFRYALVPQAGAADTADLCRRAEVLHTPLPRVIETYHAGDLPAVFRGMSVQPENVAVGAVKRAEDGKGVVVRLCEMQGRAAQGQIALFGREANVPLSPWQLKSVYLPDDEAQPIREVSLLEE